MIAKVSALTARANRLAKIIKALQAFNNCYYETDVGKAEKDLKEALEKKSIQVYDKH